MAPAQKTEIMAPAQKTEIMAPAQKTEIMAPVGCRESLAAAIQAGADSVYFGIQGLNMRSGSANNFQKEDLKEIVALCEEHHMKSYLTVNTIMYDGDLDKMRDIIDAAADAGVSAIIASDVAAMVYARQRGVEVHLSTQLNISNVEALKFYAQFADVAVLARELNMEQVKHIHEEIVRQHICGPKGQLVRIEMFAHGALCMAVSGKCYLSLHEYGKSANRGACAQVCRHGYTVHDNTHDIDLDIDNQYIMSPKDLKTIHFLNKMMDAGVEVFKIEGRARGPEYVKTVVSCYREAADSIKEGSYSDDKIRDWDERLSRVFNRGFWNGYYLGQRLGEWSPHYGSQAKEHKEYAAKVMGWYSRIGIGDMRCDAMELHKGDRIMIIGPTTGVMEMTLDQIQVDYKNVDTVHQGERFSIPVPHKVRPSDKIYKIISDYQ